MNGIERIAAAFAGSGKRAALMPYLMGGFPDLPGSLAIGEAYADGGADLVELGVPFSDPLADGPVIHAAGTQALAAGATVDGVLELAASLSQRLPVVVMTYANLVLARTPEGFADSLVEAGVSGLIVPDLPLEEDPAVLGACDARGIALVPLVAPTTPDDRLRLIGERTRGFLYTVSVAGTTGERKDGPALARRPRPREGAHGGPRSPSASGSATPEQAAPGGRHGGGRRDRRTAPAGPRGRGGRGSGDGGPRGGRRDGGRAARIGPRRASRHGVLLLHSGSLARAAPRMRVSLPDPEGLGRRSRHGSAAHEARNHGSAKVSAGGRALMGCALVTLALLAGPAPSARADGAAVSASSPRPATSSGSSPRPSTPAATSVSRPTRRRSLPGRGSDARRGNLFSGLDALGQLATMPGPDAPVTEVATRVQQVDDALGAGEQLSDPILDCGGSCDGKKVADIVSLRVRLTIGSGPDPVTGEKAFDDLSLDSLRTSSPRTSAS